MAASYALEHTSRDRQTREVTFAGDSVCLAGQVDYPGMPLPINGYPLIFILQHAGSNTRADYDHYAQVGLNCGYAVFRWDKRGTGRSGAGGRGSTTQDAIMAYDVALKQPLINLSRIVILAQSEGTVMLSKTFERFAQAHPPSGVILTSNMLDAKAIQKIDTRLLVVMGTKDWNNWEIYARDACESHNATYRHGAAFYVALDANRMLMVTGNLQDTFHDGAQQTICEWLQEL